MCLAIPGKVLSIDRTGDLAMGKVSFGGVQKEICLDWVPEVNVGDYVLAHVGFAIGVIDEAEALVTLDILKQSNMLDPELGGEGN